MLISEEELKKVKFVPCECKNCNSIFNIKRCDAKRSIKGTRKNDFCSPKCVVEYKIKNGNIECECLNCKKLFMKYKHATIKYPNHFCSRSCSATFNNKNKKTGTRRSKLEKWLEQKLNSLYPDLQIHYNRKDAINSELDIYIPSLKLAFELNGVFHYEPIYGKDKLRQIENNDNRKFQACLEKQIELCIIDVSKLSYFKESNAIPYLNIILEVLNKKGPSGN